MIGKLLLTSISIPASSTNRSSALNKNWTSKPITTPVVWSCAILRPPTIDLFTTVLAWRNSSTLITVELIYCYTDAVTFSFSLAPCEGTFNDSPLSKKCRYCVGVEGKIYQWAGFSLKDESLKRSAATAWLAQSTSQTEIHVCHECPLALWNIPMPFHI